MESKWLVIRLSLTLAVATLAFLFLIASANLTVDLVLLFRAIIHVVFKTDDVRDCVSEYFCTCWCMCAERSSSQGYLYRL